MTNLLLNAGTSEIEKPWKRLLRTPPVFSVQTPLDSAREVTQAYIAAQFAAIYGAQIYSYMPHLLTLSGPLSLCAVAGIRAADDQPLFLEHYLDQPIEQEICQRTAIQPQRTSIVEIGNLVATHKGASHLLFILINLMLHQAGYEWVVFTATPQVQKILTRLNIPTETIAAADILRLPTQEQRCWGRYYESQPQIVIGHLPQGVNALAHRPILSWVTNLYQEQIDAIAQTLSYGKDHDPAFIAA